MTFSLQKILLWVGALVALSFSNATEFPVSKPIRHTLRIAVVAPLSDVPQSSIGRQVVSGVKYSVEMINQAGGIQGQLVDLIAYDDHFKPDQTAQLSLRAVREDGALAVLTVGTATALSVIEARIPELHKVPLFPLRTGAAAMREPFNPFVFNIRAGYRAELQRLVRHLDSMGIHRIALLYQSDAYGDFGRSVVRTEMALGNRSPIGEAAYDRTSSDMNLPAEILGRLHSDAIIMIAGGTQAISFIKAFRQRGFRSLIVGLSDVDPQLVVKEVGPELARGVGMSQVFPSLNKRVIPLVREFHQAHQKFGQSGETAKLAAFEGFIASKVVLEGLKRAQAKQYSLAEALNNLGHFDLGGYVVTFSAVQHEGSSYADLLVIGSDGQIRY